jgi:hypothetical protein
VGRGASFGGKKLPTFFAERRSGRPRNSVGYPEAAPAATARGLPPRSPARARLHQSAPIHSLFHTAPLRGNKPKTPRYPLLLKFQKPTWEGAHFFCTVQLQRSGGIKHPTISSSFGAEDSAAYRRRKVVLLQMSAIRRTACGRRGQWFQKHLRLAPL